MTSQHQHQQHWHPEDIDDALVADFDGSLSGLCIMSLSFDFTARNSTAVAAAAAAAAVATTASATGSGAPHLPVAVSQQLQASLSGNSTTQEVSPASHEPPGATAGGDTSCGESSFKRFKAAAADDQHENNTKIARQLQKLKSCLNAAAASNPLAAHLSAITQASQQAADSHRNSPSPQAAQGVGQPLEPEVDEDEPLSESSRCSSTVDARSPSPTSSSVSRSSSTCSSQPQSPTNPATATADDKCAPSASGGANQAPSSLSGGSRAAKSGALPGQQQSTTAAAIAGGCGGGSAAAAAAAAADKQLSVYTVKDSLMSSQHHQGSSLKESSYTTSVITTSAPMPPHTFKSIHHPFHSFKQFPLSPYQFSNSSLNQHDFYDRYLSQHDSHQPLQTPLIGIERTQDLLSLKLPPHGPGPGDEFGVADSLAAATGGHRFGSTKPPGQEWMFADHTNNDKDPSVELSVGKTGSEEAPGEHYAHFPYNALAGPGATAATTNRAARSPAGQREPIDLNVSYLTGEPVGPFKRSASGSLKSNHQLFAAPHHKGGSPARGPPAPPEVGEQVQPDEDDEERAADEAEGEGERDEEEGEEEGEEADNASQMAQESVYGMDASKHKFQYILAAPISVATKLSEDTMTYLNQGQAYEIKLENLTDVAEARKGFMCSIINIGFQERHMQQAENELWQQWSQQHPNEKIFSVDMKLSYNVFGVESDGLNKYEFLWDSSKVAGVFIRINSISTEFTPKKHGGEKGVPFKLSIETFSYNSKTHDSYFISAACCQIKVFKPKGAERKIRSDRDKISRRPLQEQDKYHGPCEHSVFHECSLASLHPLADSSLCYYRHSHGHFASKQVVTTTGSTPGGGGQAAASNQRLSHQPNAANINQQHGGSDDELEASPNKLNSVSSPSNRLDGSTSPTSGGAANHSLRAGHSTEPATRDFHELSRCISANKSYPHQAAAAPPPPLHHQQPPQALLSSQAPSHLNYSASRIMHSQNHYGSRLDSHSDYPSYGQPPVESATTSSCFNSFAAELAPLQQPLTCHSFNHHHHHHHQMYHSQQAARSAHHHPHPHQHPHSHPHPHHHHPVINSHHSSSHFNMAYHYGAHPGAQPAAHLSSTGAASSYDTSAGSSSMPQNTFASINHFPAALHQQSSQVQVASAAAAVAAKGSSLYHRHQLLPRSDSKGPAPLQSSSFRAANLAAMNTPYTPVTSGSSTSGLDQLGQPHMGHEFAAHTAYHLSGTTGSGLQTNTDNPLNSCVSAHESAGHPKQSRTMSSDPYYASSTGMSARLHHQSDGYLSSGGGSLPDTASTPSSGSVSGGSSGSTSSGNGGSAATAAAALHWMHSSPGAPHHPTTGHLSSGGCAPGSGPRTHSLSHNDTHIYSAGNNQFECANTQNNNNTNNNNSYDSDHNSPPHLENQHTSDSSSSCQSRFKNSAPLILAPAFAVNTTNTNTAPTTNNNNNINTTAGATNHSQQEAPQRPSPNNGLLQITANSTCTEVRGWLAANRFSPLAKTFANFSGSDLLRLSKTDLIEICGVIDGIRLYNSLHITQPIKQHIFCDQNLSQLDYHHS